VVVSRAGVTCGGAVTAAAGDLGAPVRALGSTDVGAAGLAPLRWRAVARRRGRAAPFCGRCGSGGARAAPAAGQQREAAQGDAGDDGHAPGDLGRADRIAEGDGACRRADQWLEIEEGAGHLGRYPALPVGEQREGQQCPAECQSDGGKDSSRVVGCRGHALGGHRERQHGQGSPQELQGGDRDRVTARQHPDLRHGEGGGHQQRCQHESIAAGGHAAAVAARDQADTRQ
jgi:hypothetical protein